MRRLFTSDRFIFTIIVVNAIVLFLQECGISNPVINLIDALCTVLFIVEMAVKHRVLGVRGYWSNGWNIMDGTLVLLSLPSLVSYLVPSLSADFSFLLALRVLRMFRFSRLVHVFPNFPTIMRNAWKALHNSLAVFAGFVILIVVFALISCALFKDTAPQYFGTPWDAIYSIFTLCTVEGWNQFPDALSALVAPWAAHFVRIYFIVLLVAGGIVGMSLVNSIFVDAMVSDNNDSLEQQIKDLRTQLTRIESLLEESRQQLDAPQSDEEDGGKG